jgi:hypothetical protein
MGSRPAANPRYLKSGQLASWVQVRNYLKEKVAAPVKKVEDTAIGIRHADDATPSLRKTWHWLSLQAAVARSV